jgi:hypothetical protein
MASDYDIISYQFTFYSLILHLYFYLAHTSCFSFIFASDIFILTSLTTTIAQKKHSFNGYVRICIWLLTFSIMYATTPDYGFELAETCSDIHV